MKRTEADQHASGDADASLPAGKTPRRRGRRNAIVLAALLVFGLASCEWFLRARYGLGTPVLILNDPQTDYRAAPNQDVVRLGNRIRYNQWSMRSDDFPKAKSDPAELRVLMLGDSVVNGGNQTDHANLASEILTRRLSEKLGRRVIVANVSAGSWGPENILAYLQKFGTFDADVLLLVQSTHDTSDAMPTTMPAREELRPRPRFAIEEAVERTISGWTSKPTASDSSTPQGDAHDSPPLQVCLAAFTDIIDLLGPGRTIVALHLEEPETPPASPGPGHDVMRDLATSRGARVVELGPAFVASRDAGRNPYRDFIHPNDVGQAVIADAVETALLEALGRRIAASSTPSSTQPQ